MMMSRTIRIAFIWLAAAVVTVAAITHYFPQYFSMGKATQPSQKNSFEINKATAPANWKDEPATIGDWAWSFQNEISEGKFGEGLFSLACNKTDGTISLARRVSKAQKPVLTIFTSNESRTFNGKILNGSVIVKLSPNDTFLDSMAFERGNFGIEVKGLPTIYVPSWPEVSRVIEDCR